VAFISAQASADPKPLVTFEKCTFVSTEWADGDSFQIKFTDGKMMTVRLYAADCMELHINTDSDIRRLRDQRRYFGITEVKGDAPDSVSLARGFGKKAHEFTKEALQKPFTIHTRHHKALGDGKNERFYAFVVTENGDDLATELVRAGLARTRGVGTEMVDGTSRERYKEKLADFEAQAAKREKGIWKFTDWEKLPNERDVQRKEDEEDQIAAGDALPEGFSINPNTASRDDLILLDGIGEVLADAIIEKREEEPFKKAEDLIAVPGIKQKTLDKFSRHLDFAAP
jgi:competence ComEA-like helix-hairpin-helix protein